jgi:hypothetical protein
MTRWVFCFQRRVVGRAAADGAAGANAFPFTRPRPVPNLPPLPQVRRLSVKRIMSPIARDNLGYPVPGGLYDPAMGPLTPGERCVTCGLSGAACAGHFGHIELAVPVYNPLVFG